MFNKGESIMLWKQLIKENLVAMTTSHLNLEGYNVSLEQISLLIDELQSNIYNHASDEMSHILMNLTYTYGKVMSGEISLNESSPIRTLQAINQAIGKGDLFRQPGQIRMGGVKITSTNYVPNLPKASVIDNDIMSLLQSGQVEDILAIMAYCMKTQTFYDGNKRTAILFTNLLLGTKHNAILNLPSDSIETFRDLFIAYYEDESKLTPLVDFLKDHVMHGIF